MNMRSPEIIENEILNLLAEYHQSRFPKRIFQPGDDLVPVSGKVLGPEELQHIALSGMDGWFTTGRFNDLFEKQLAQFLGTRKVLTVNSGSSANLIATAALTDKEWGEKAIFPGDEIITVAVSFPTTLNTLIQYGAVPVFVDVDIPSYNIQVNQLEKALSPKTKAVVVAHTLGNPFDVESVAAFCKKHNLWLIEDCCDALGATVNGRHVGTFGDIGTLSFYPAHHITMGEGGAVFTHHSRMAKIMESFRDWGRDCWCAPGKDNTCGKRFDWCLGQLPRGYDHKYIYSRNGYNLKITDMQAALGLAQRQKLPEFISTRRANHDFLTQGLNDLQDYLILHQATEHSNPSWFGYLITLKENISRTEIVKKLDEAKIATRLLFAGDIRKQPYFEGIPHRSVGELNNTSIILERTFWIGVTPLITKEMLNYVVDTFHRILKS